MTKQPPNGLKRYFEWTARGARTERTAYVLTEWDLPEPIPGAEWGLDSKFNAAQEILRDPAMKDVFKTAIVKGIKIVETPAADGSKAKGK